MFNHVDIDLPKLERETIDGVRYYSVPDEDELIKLVSITSITSHFNKEVFINAIEICLELGIKNFQFGDGFGSPLTSNDVPEILKITGSQNQIKVVGGIKKLTQVIDLFDNGISCVGTSNFCEIFEEVNVI